MPAVFALRLAHQLPLGAFDMHMPIEVVEWIAVVVGGFSIAGGFVVAALVGLLNRRIEDGPAGRGRSALDAGPRPAHS